MRCEEFQGAIDPYLDGELPVMPTVRMHGHVVFCERCRRVLDSEAALHGRLAEEAPDDAPPAGLRERILQEVGAERVPSREAGVGWRRLPVLGAWLAGAATVGLLLLVVLTIPVRDTLEDLPPVAEELVAKHRLYGEGRGGTLETRTAETSRMSEWFGRRLSFPVELPRLTGPDERLLGGRVSSVADGPAAYLRYDWRGRRVSLFVTRLLPAEHLGGTARMVEGVEIHTSTVHGIGLAWWGEEDEGRLYAAVSKDGDQALLEFALRCVQSGRAAAPDKPPT